MTYATDPPRILSNNLCVLKTIRFNRKGIFDHISYPVCQTKIKILFTIIDGNEQAGEIARNRTLFNTKHYYERTEHAKCISSYIYISPFLAAIFYSNILYRKLRNPLRRCFHPQEETRFRELGFLYERTWALAPMLYLVYCLSFPSYTMCFVRKQLPFFYLLFAFSSFILPIIYLTFSLQNTFTKS